MSGHRFDAEVRRLLEHEREVTIETRRPDGQRQQAVIWVVVDAGEAYVRSWRGERARWFQAALDRPDDVLLVVAGRRVGVRPILATDDESVARCSRALERKYAGDPSTPAMVRSQILGTTLRLEPRPD